MQRGYNAMDNSRNRHAHLPSKLAEIAESRGDQTSEAKRHYRAALRITVALREAGRLAPVDAWMVEDLEARLERVSQEAAP